jgi:hypothetical protein
VDRAGGTASVDCCRTAQGQQRPRSTQGVPRTHVSNHCRVHFSHADIIQQLGIVTDTAVVGALGSALRRTWRGGGVESLEQGRAWAKGEKWLGKVRCSVCVGGVAEGVAGAWG